MSARQSASYHRRGASLSSGWKHTSLAGSVAVCLIALICQRQCSINRMSNLRSFVLQSSLQMVLKAIYDLRVWKRLFTLRSHWSVCATKELLRKHKRLVERKSMNLLMIAPWKKHLGRELPRKSEITVCTSGWLGDSQARASILDIETLLTSPSQVALDGSSCRSVFPTFAAIPRLI